MTAIIPRRYPVEHQSTAKLLRTAQERRIYLAVEDGWLVCDAPIGVLDDALRAELTAHREELINWLVDGPPPTLRDRFTEEFGVREVRWTPHNTTRFLRATGERPERIEEMRSALLALDAGWLVSHRVVSRITLSRPFDHGEMWARGRQPWMIVGHPYHICDDARRILDTMGRTFPALRVSIDDRPGYYEATTHHVRIELVEARKPWSPPRSTAKTRAAVRTFRKALTEPSQPH